MLRANSTFSMSSGEHGSSRSANTFPLLSVNLGAGLSLSRVATVRSFHLLPFAVALFGVLQARANQVHVTHGGFGPLLGFLLEGMQHVESALEFDRVDHTVCIAALRNDELKHLGAAKARQCRCAKRRLAALRQVERMSSFRPRAFRKFLEIFVAGANPNKVLHAIIPYIFGRRADYARGCTLFGPFLR